MAKSFEVIRSTSRGVFGAENTPRPEGRRAIGVERGSVAAVKYDGHAAREHGHGEVRPGWVSEEGERERVSE